MVSHVCISLGVHLKSYSEINRIRTTIKRNVFAVTSEISVFFAHFVLSSSLSIVLIAMLHVCLTFIMYNIVFYSKERISLGDSNEACFSYKCP